MRLHVCNLRDGRTAVCMRSQRGAESGLKREPVHVFINAKWKADRGDEISYISMYNISGLLHLSHMLMNV